MRLAPIGTPPSTTPSYVIPSLKRTSFVVRSMHHKKTHRELPIRAQCSRERRPLLTGITNVRSDPMSRLAHILEDAEVLGPKEPQVLVLRAQQMNC